MQEYRADLHIHTVLSPCGSLEMSPEIIIEEALKKGLDIIGIADHNSTRQCEVIRQLGEKRGLTVLCGAEINTREEVHCLAFFESSDELLKFQLYLDEHLQKVKNKPELFGDQVWVDEKGNILGEEDRLLIVGLDQSIDEIADKVDEMNGIFIPAHIDRQRNSISSQLGFLTPGLKVSGIEISRVASRKDVEIRYSWIKDYTVVTNSDAHIPEDIGVAYTTYLLEEPSFKEIKKALHNENGRRVINVCLKR